MPERGEEKENISRAVCHRTDATETGLHARPTGEMLSGLGIGNWGYTYQAHSKYGRLGRKPALDILDERYAKGDISRDEYVRLKVEISGA